MGDGQVHLLGEGSSPLWAMLCWEWKPGDKSPSFPDGVGSRLLGGLVVEGKAQAPPKGSVASDPWTMSYGCALITRVTWPLEGLPTMDPPERGN